MTDVVIAWFGLLFGLTGIGVLYAVIARLVRGGLS